jgi:t-SNARE complex subunit (syntaxin)
MVKDRLQEFEKLTSKNVKLPKQESSSAFPVQLEDVFTRDNTCLLNNDNWNDIESYLTHVNESRKKLDAMDICLGQMREIHDKILMSPGVHPKYTEDLNISVERFKQLSHSVSNVAKKLNEEILHASRKKDAKYRIEQSHCMAINRRLRDTLYAFNQEQLQYRDKCKSKINSYLTISNLQMPDDEVDEAIESGRLFNTVGIMMAERDKKNLFEDVKSRHDDILRLEASIRELHEMFQDMTMLVESQGELTNRIEANVESAVGHATKALENVNYANEMKKRNIKLKICLAICVLISIIILFLVGTSVFCFYVPFVCR